MTPPKKAAISKQSAGNYLKPIIPQALCLISSFIIPFLS